MTEDVWGALNSIPGDVKQLNVGAARILVQSHLDEWLIAHHFHNPETEAGSDSKLDDADRNWIRYITVQGDPLTVQPALPDRPIVIRPLSPMVILPGRWGRFFFSVPLWVRFVSHSDANEQVMAEVPTQDLSLSWFGDMVTGELCYAVGSRLLRVVPEADADRAFARCEIEIRNGSRERLQFERICVHVEHMRLYAGEGKFWSNQVRVVFKGAEQISQLSYLPAPPHSVSEARVVCEPREDMDTNIFKRSFNLIREFTGI